MTIIKKEHTVIMNPKNKKLASCRNDNSSLFTDKPNNTPKPPVLSLIQREVSCNLSPLDNRYHTQTEILGNFFSDFSFTRARVQVEIEWFLFLCHHKDLPYAKEYQKISVQKSQLTDIYRKFSLQDFRIIKQYEVTTQHDVKAIEYFLQQKLQELKISSLNHLLHFGCTSDDINNIAYAHSIQQAHKEVLLPQCRSILDTIETLATEWKDHAMLAHTHGQTATPTTMGKEMFNFYVRLKRVYQAIEKQPYFAKLNGAVGNYNTFVLSFPDIDWEHATAEFLQSFHLQQNKATTQIEPHDYLAYIFHNWIQWNSILLDLCRDIWNYSLMGYFTITKEQEAVGSSTMPHKTNPIDFENAEGNIGIANSLLQHCATKLPVSRLQRDLSDSTVLRNMGSIFGYCLISMLSCSKGLSRLILNKEKITQDLDSSWEILGEAIQTILRKNGIEKGYERVKKAFLHKNTDKNTYLDFVETLELPEDEKKVLKNLTPQSYIGLANKFRKKPLKLS